MNAVLKEEQDQRINTSANHKTTWTTSVPGSRSTEQISSLAGNSANAELAAGQRAINVSEIFSGALGHCCLCPIFKRLPISEPVHLPSLVFLDRSSLEIDWLVLQLHKTPTILF